MYKILFLTIFFFLTFVNVAYSHSNDKKFFVNATAVISTTRYGTTSSAEVSLKYSYYRYKHINLFIDSSTTINNLISTDFIGDEISYTYKRITTGVSAGVIIGQGEHASTRLSLLYSVLKYKTYTINLNDSYYIAGKYSENIYGLNIGTSF